MECGSSCTGPMGGFAPVRLPRLFIFAGFNFRGGDRDTSEIDARYTTESEASQSVQSTLAGACASAQVIILVNVKTTPESVNSSLFFGIEFGLLFISGLRVTRVHVAMQTNVECH